MEAAAMIFESNFSSFAFEDSELFIPHLICNNPYSGFDHFDSNLAAFPASFSWLSEEQDHAFNFQSSCSFWPADESSIDVCPAEEPNPILMDQFFMLNEDHSMVAGGESGLDYCEETVSNKRKFQTSVGNDHSIADQASIYHQSEISPQKKGKISEQKQNKAKKIKRSSTSDEENVACRNGQSSSSYSSEDDSEEQHGRRSNSNSKRCMPANLSCKTRATRGSASDPQSLYARKRREKINERLRILQNLVPNGTKVDISTMLEEAVQYVKFLQLQIKVLSSDDHWMYAPIAYNGTNIGIDLKISHMS